MKFKVYDANTNGMVYSGEDLERAKAIATEFRHNTASHYFINKVETVWTTQTLDEAIAGAPLGIEGADGGSHTDS